MAVVNFLVPQIIQQRPNPRKRRARRGGHRISLYPRICVKSTRSVLSLRLRRVTSGQEERPRKSKRDQERRQETETERNSLTRPAYAAISDSVAVVYGRPIGRSIAPLEPTPPTKSPLPSATATSHGRTPRRMRAWDRRVRGASSERTQRAPSKINRPMATGTRA